MAGDAEDDERHRRRTEEDRRGVSTCFPSRVQRVGPNSTDVTHHQPATASCDVPSRGAGHPTRPHAQCLLPPPPRDKRHRKPTDSIASRARPLSLSETHPLLPDPAVELAPPLPAVDVTVTTSRLCCCCWCSPRGDGAAVGVGVGARAGNIPSCTHCAKVGDLAAGRARRSSPSSRRELCAGQLPSRLDCPGR